MFSIIIPTFNGSNFVSEAIESYFAFPAKNKSLFVIDDCSTDETCKIVSDYAAKDSSISLICRKKNYGASTNRNYILNSLPKGEWVLNLDQDDILLPCEVTEKLKLYQDSNVGAIYFDNMISRTDSLFLEYKWYKSLFEKITIRNLWLLFIFYPPRLGCTIFQTTTLKDVGGFGRTRFGGEDWEIFYNIILSGRKLKYVRKPLIIRREGEQNTSKIHRKSRLNNFEKICMSKSFSVPMKFIIKIVFAYRKRKG